MATKKPIEEKVAEVVAQPRRSLAASLSKKATLADISFWIVGDTPLITHAWSHKAKLEMLGKQVGATKPGKEKRDPSADFVSSLYPMGEDAYGFPVTGIKNCILSAAHKDKGLPRTSAMAALFLHAEMVRVMPALAGAICDMPLVRIWGSKPEMREDMTKIGAGLNKIANLAYRAQFTQWAIRVRGTVNTAVMTDEQLAVLVQDSGMSSGLGEWRNERRGVFGAFHLANIDEERQWDAFRNGKGALPAPISYQEAAE